MVAAIKIHVEAHSVGVINRNYHRLGRFEERARFDPYSSVFKKWSQTMREINTKPFVSGFIKYEFK